MKKSLTLFIVLMAFLTGSAQELTPIELLKPDKSKGLPVMQAFDARASVREWSSRPLTLQELSDLVWAANGINRPEEKKRTAPSAMNAQDIDVYVLREDGAYLYDAEKNLLAPVAGGDLRPLAGKTDAPLTLVLIADLSRFRSGDDQTKLNLGYIDCGIVSQNIALFCAGTGLKTRPRASFPETDKLRAALKLKDSQRIILNHPVGYGK